MRALERARTRAEGRAARRTVPAIRPSAAPRRRLSDGELDGYGIDGRRSSCRGPQFLYAPDSPRRRLQSFMDASVAARGSGAVMGKYLLLLINISVTT